jgi:hypothetical protein
MSTTSTAPTGAVRSLRTRISEAMLRTGTELAIDQRELEDNLATLPKAAVGYSSASGAVRLARWADALVLWLAWRIHPRTFVPNA